MNIIDGIFQWLQKIFQWWIIVMPWETGLRVRVGKRITLMNGGIYLKLPIIDQVYVQTASKRVIGGPIQTISTADGKTLTICATVGYRINDVHKLYHTCYQTEMTIINLVLSKVAEFIAKSSLSEATPMAIEEFVNSNINLMDFGLDEVIIKIVGYAQVRTYRLIQDSHYISEGLDMSPKK